MKKLRETSVRAGEGLCLGKDGKYYHEPFGEIITTEYESPRGAGKIIAVFEDVPGYRDSHGHFDCAVCEKLYDVDYNRAPRGDDMLRLTKK